MKIDELRRDNGIEEDPEGVFVLLSDLPPQRDAKTDPPPNGQVVVIYGGNLWPGAVGFCDADGRWWIVLGLTPISIVTHWSEILHW